jgi:hypothetical protein
LNFNKIEQLRIFYVCSKKINKQNKIKPLNQSQSNYTLTIEYSPISIGWLRFFNQIEGSLAAMRELGISDAQLSEITSIFTDTNLYLLFLTLFVSVFHVSIFVVVVVVAYSLVYSNLVFELILCSCHEYSSRLCSNFWHSKTTLTFGESEKLPWAFLLKLVRLN